MIPKKDEYMRGYGDGFKDGNADRLQHLGKLHAKNIVEIGEAVIRAEAAEATTKDMLDALKEARAFILAPAEDLLWGVVHRMDAVISKAEAAS